MTQWINLQEYLERERDPVSIKNEGVPNNYPDCTHYMPRSAEGGGCGGSRSAVQRVFTVFYVDAVVYYYISTL